MRPSDRRNDYYWHLMISKMKTLVVSYFQVQSCCLVFYRFIDFKSVLNIDRSFELKISLTSVGSALGSFLSYFFLKKL